MIDKNEIKKDLYKSKNMARFSHYCAGKLYYTFDALGATFMFPINTVEAGPTINDDESGLSMYEVETVKLSSDLGITNFGSEIKASDLNRWIAKAIDAGEMINMKPE